MKHWLRAFTYFRPDTTRMAWALALLVGTVAANLLKPWPLAYILDTFTGQLRPRPKWADQPQDIIGVAVAAIVVIYCVHGLLSAGQNYLTIKVGLCGLRRVRDALLQRLQYLSLRFHQAATSGDLIYRASWDTFAFQTFFQQGLVLLCTSVLTLALMLAIMWRVNSRLTLVALALVPLVVLSMRLFGREMRARGEAAQQSDSLVTSAVQQTITALPMVQAYGREEHEGAAFARRTETAQVKRLAQHGWELVYWLAVTVVFGLGTAAIVWVGSREVFANKLTIGELVVFLAYLAQLYEPLNQLSHVGATVSGARAGTQRVFEILDAPEQVPDAPNARPLTPPVRGAIEFEGVSFEYVTGRRVLDSVRFKIAPGESVAILGRSGAGKTTLLNLVPRLFDPQAGSIKLDGNEIREVRLRDLRAQMALVMQEPLLLPGTIAENIAYGRPEAPQEDIIKAAQAAHADDFIRRLPRQYDTLMGEGAARLSVGEKQRLNLARAFLRDAPILLLDEPTSALDAESEALVLESLLRLVKGRTTLMVAHRLATIKQMDKLLVLEAGRVSEFGSPAELAGTGGYYSRVLGLQR